MSQLPSPEYRVLLLIHPNAVAVHGAYQLRTWWGHLAARGLLITRPEHDIEPFLLAADYIVGDHGSVTHYGAAVGVPTQHGAYHEADVHPDSRAAGLAAIAPRLADNLPVAEQLAQASAQFDAVAMDEVAGRISSEPGGFARHTRALLYGLLGLGQPAVPALLGDAPVPPSLRSLAGNPARREIRGLQGARGMSELIRVTLSRGVVSQDVHLRACVDDVADEGDLGAADVLCFARPVGADVVAAQLAQFPGCVVCAGRTEDGALLLAVRERRIERVASLVHALLTWGGGVGEEAMTD